MTDHDSRPAQSSGDLPELQRRLAELDERPVNEHPDVLEAVHGQLSGDLDRLVIPRADGSERPAGG